MTLLNPILRGKKQLLAWLAMAFMLCLMPGPAWWGSKINQPPREKQVRLVSTPQLRQPSGAAVLVWCEQDKTAKQWIAHFLLMGGVAWSIARQARPSRRGRFFAATASLIIVAGASILIELLQTLLPASFERGCSVDDICVSLIGGAVGAGLGLCLPAPSGSSFSQQINRNPLEL